MSSPPIRKTRASNATTHPGLVTKSAARRSPGRAKAEKDAKKAAKAAAKQAKIEAEQARLKRVADFESQVMMNEEVADATPRPNFTPRATASEYLYHMIPILTVFLI